MRVITEFPRPVREIEHTWIPLSDGTRLAARIWLPEDAEQKSRAGYSWNICRIAKAMALLCGIRCIIPILPVMAMPQSAWICGGVAILRACF